MKGISLSVSEDDYEAFRAYAARHDRSIAELMREAMALYRSERMERLDRLVRLPIVTTARPVAPLPSRADVMDELTSRHR